MTTVALRPKRVWSDPAGTAMLAKPGGVAPDGAVVVTDSVEEVVEAAVFLLLPPPQPASTRARTANPQSRRVGSGMAACSTTPGRRSPNGCRCDRSPPLLSPQPRSAAAREQWPSGPPAIHHRQGGRHIGDDRQHQQDHAKRRCTGDDLVDVDRRAIGDNDGTDQ